MKLSDLQIQLQPSWAPNAGQYVCTVKYEEGQSNEVKLVLDPEISMQLLRFIGPAITAAAAAASRQIEANIIGALAAPQPTLEIEQDIQEPPTFPKSEEQF